MAAPMKKGLDYFPHDTHLDDDTKYLIVEFGMEGYGVYFMLLQKIYSQGYYCRFGEREFKMFANEVKLERGKLRNILAHLLSDGFFNNALYEEHGILTSEGIQKRYAEATKKRKKTVISEFTLVNVELTRVNVELTKVKGELTQQSKVKESKVNKSTSLGDKEKETLNKNTSIEQGDNSEELPPFIQQEKSPYSYHKSEPLDQTDKNQTAFRIAYMDWYEQQFQVRPTLNATSKKKLLETAARIRESIERKHGQVAFRVVLKGFKACLKFMPEDMKKNPKNANPSLILHNLDTLIACVAKERAKTKQTKTSDVRTTKLRRD